jgi:hypothetical protein
MLLLKVTLLCRLSAVEADGAKSAGRFMACHDFIMTAYMHSITRRDLSRYNLDMDREMAATGHEVRIWV